MKREKLTVYASKKSIKLVLKHVSKMCAREGTELWATNDYFNEIAGTDLVACDQQQLLQQLFSIEYTHHRTRMRASTLNPCFSSDCTAVTSPRSAARCSGYLSFCDAFLEAMALDGESGDDTELAKRKNPRRADEGEPLAAEAALRS